VFDNNILPTLTMRYPNVSIELELDHSGCHKVLPTNALDMRKLSLSKPGAKHKGNDVKMRPVYSQVDAAGAPLAGAELIYSTDDGLSGGKAMSLRDLVGFFTSRMTTLSGPRRR
jgi:hypothetical protein